MSGAGIVHSVQADRHVNVFDSPFQGCWGSVVCVVSVTPLAVNRAVVQPVVESLGSAT